jgi:type VI secretion system protein ImpF
MTPLRDAGHWLGLGEAGRDDLPQRLSRDIEELLNHLCLRDGARQGAAGGSVLAWGLPSCAGRTVDEAFLGKLARDVGTALRHFEPRLDPRSIDVTPRPGARHMRSRCRLILRARPAGPAAAELDWEIRVDANFGRVSVALAGEPVPRTR